MNWQPRIGAIPQVYARNFHEIRSPKDIELLCSAMSFFVPRKESFAYEISESGTIRTASVSKADMMPHLFPHHSHIFSLGVSYCGGGSAGGTAIIDGNHALRLVHHVAIATHIADFGIRIRVNLYNIAAPDKPLKGFIRCFHASGVGNGRFQHDGTDFFQFDHDLRKEQIRSGGEAADETGVAVLNS